MTEQLLLCYQYLPQLHVAGFRSAIQDQQLDWRQHDDQQGTLAAECLRQVAPYTLQLRRLELTNFWFDSPDCLPRQLQLLHLNRRIYRFPPGMSVRYPQLTELGFFDLRYSLQTILGGLGQFGQQLQTLRLSSYFISVDLDVVLNTFPNLSELDIDVVEVSCVAELRPDMLQQLRKLRLRSINRIEQGLTTKLLKIALQLRLVEFKQSELDVKEMQQAAMEGNCMRHLEQLKVQLFNIYPKSEKEVEYMIYSLPLFCPHLHTISICFKL